MKKIYLDYAATSPVKKEVLAAMKPYFLEKFGNPSSVHSFGREVRVAIDRARAQVANFLNCQPEEIIFTSGGTESDNLAIRGIIKALGNFSKNLLSIAPASQSQSTCSVSACDHAPQPAQVSCKKLPRTFIVLPHIITSVFEHHAVLHTCQDLEKQGLAEVTYVKPDKQGIIDPDDIKKAIKPNTVLVSIMYVNNEIGTIQPIGEISRLISQNNEVRIKNKVKTHNSSFIIHNSPIYFHTDAVQAIEYQPCDVKKLGVDMLSLSAHKFGGPKGIGVLYVKKGTSIKALQTGGAQEYNLRAGTENVAGIVGLAKAIQLLNPKSQILNPKQIQNSNPPAGGQNSKRLRNLDLENSNIVSDLELRVLNLTRLRDYFINQIIKKIPDVRLNGSKKLRNPNNVNMSFKFVEGESILIHLDLAGIAASSGSACTSGSLEPSHVLLSIGLRHEDAHGAVRFTLGEKTTREEIDYTVNNLIKIVKKLRAMSPYNNKNF